MKISLERNTFMLFSVFWYVYEFGTSLLIEKH